MPPDPNDATHANADAGANAGANAGGASTIAEAPGIGRGRSLLAQAKDELAGVGDVVEGARKSLPGWDNLAFVRAFAQAAAAAAPLLATTTNPLSRRLIARSLLRLVPPALLPVPAGPAGNALSTTGALHLDERVLARADDNFALHADDAPGIHPSWSAFLARPGLLDGALQPRRHETLLAPRSLSPGAETSGSAVLVRIDEIKPGPNGGVASCRVLHSDGTSSLRRLTSDGKDAGPAELKLDVLKAWLENAGPGARALDLRKADDRCLWLAFSQALRTRKLDGLLARESDPARRADVVEAVVDAAADTVAWACLDPLSCRFVLPPATGKHGEAWSAEAAWVLLGTGLCVEVAPRLHNGGSSRSSGGRELVWLDAVADPGVIGGALSAVGQARAFARLAVSLLAPLGALPMVGARDGNGVVVACVGEDGDGVPWQRGPWWVEPSRAGQAVTPLSQAWQEGRGRHLPEPRGAYAHDVKALPEWLGHFGDAIAGDTAPAPVPASVPSPTDGGVGETGPR